MNNQTRHWIAHIALAVMVIVLADIILHPASAIKPDTALIENLKQRNAILASQSDSLRKEATFYGRKVDSLSQAKKAVEYRYIERNTVINEIPDSSLADSLARLFERRGL